MMWFIAVRDALRDAELPTFTLRKRAVQASVSKSLLWTIFSFSDEEKHVAVRALAARAGCDVSTAYVAIACLVREGILRKCASPRCRQKYEIVAARLREFKSDTPLSLPPRGGKQKKRTSDERGRFLTKACVQN